MAFNVFSMLVLFPICCSLSSWLSDSSTDLEAVLVQFVTAHGLFTSPSNTVSSFFLFLRLLIKSAILFYLKFSSSFLHFSLAMYTESNQVQEVKDFFRRLEAPTTTAVSVTNCFLHLYKCNCIITCEICLTVSEASSASVLVVSTTSSSPMNLKNFVGVLFHLNQSLSSSNLTFNFSLLIYSVIFFSSLT